MPKWRLESDDETQLPSVPTCDQATQDLAPIPWDANASTEDEQDILMPEPQLESCKTQYDWDITSPDVKPPHVEWPINSKELEILMPKDHFVKLAKVAFVDPVGYKILGPREVHNVKVYISANFYTLATTV